MSADDVHAGKAAWQRIRESGRRNFDDWIAVATALAIGKVEALKSAQTNQPVGSRYNRAMGEWLLANGLDGINAQERYRALQCLENLDAITSWRDGLDEATRRRLNHPGAIWSHWRHSTRPASHRQNVVRSTSARQGKYIRPFHWSSDALRRAATALRESRSTDYFILAKAALSAAIRNEADLLELISDPPTSRRSTERSAEIPAHATA